MTNAPRTRVSRYCLRCQAVLPPVDSRDARCPDCRLQYDPRNSDTYQTRPVAGFRKSFFFGVLLAILYGILSYTLIVAWNEPGWAAILALPVCVGAVVGYTVSTEFMKFSFQLLLALAVVGCICTGLLAMDVSGLFCGLIGAAFLLLPTFLGLIVGNMLRRYVKVSRWDRFDSLRLLAIMTVPFVVLGVEKVFPRSVDDASVTTEVLFEAPPPATWDSVMFYEEVTHEPPLLLRLALPRPQRSEGTKTREGEIVRCIYDRGYLTKRITALETDRRLSFEVVEQKLHFERDVTLLGGSFELAACADDPGATRLSLTTRYRRHLYPKWLWEPVERVVVRSLHRHVLEGMREKAENGLHGELPLKAGLEASNGTFQRCVDQRSEVPSSVSGSRLETPSPGRRWPRP